MGAEKVVVVRSGDNSTRAEYKAAGASTPGQLLAFDSAGDVKRHAVAGGSQSALFANIDFTYGKDIDDDYADNAQVQTIAALPGDIINALLKNGESVAIGDEVESAGDGDLQKHVADTQAAPNVVNSITGIAKEALDLSDSSLADPTSRRFLVEIG